jgi:hypothetical protein
MPVTILPIRFLKLEQQGFHLQVKVRLNGKWSNMLIDTGASQTVFDHSRILSFVGNRTLEERSILSTGLGTNTMKSHVVLIHQMDLGQIRILDYPSVVLDLSHVNTSYERMKIKPIDGVLGSDILKMFHAVIDYRKKALILEAVKARKPRKKS